MARVLNEKRVEKLLDKTYSRNLQEYYDISQLLTILKPEEEKHWEDLLIYMGRRIGWYAQEFDKIPRVNFWHKVYFYMKEIQR